MPASMGVRRLTFTTVRVAHSDRHFALAQGEYRLAGQPHQGRWLLKRSAAGWHVISNGGGTLPCNAAPAPVRRELLGMRRSDCMSPTGGGQKTFFTAPPGLNWAGCEMDLAPLAPSVAWCLVVPRNREVKKAIGVELKPTGHIKICRGMRCVGNADIFEPPLFHGQSASLGPFRCTSVRDAIRCVVKKTGRGFVLHLHSVTRI